MFLPQVREKVSTNKNISKCFSFYYSFIHTIYIYIYMKRTLAKSLFFCHFLFVLLLWNNAFYASSFFFVIQNRNKRSNISTQKTLFPLHVYRAEAEGRGNMYTASIFMPLWVEVYWRGWVFACFSAHENGLHWLLAAWPFTLSTGG